MPHDPTRHSTTPDADEVSPGDEWALFALDGHRVAIEVRVIREIVPPRPLTPLPGSEPYVAGVMNVRGRLITVLDLGLRLCLEAAVSREHHSVVVLEHGERLVGLAVDEVSYVIRSEGWRLDDSAAALRSARFHRDYLRGVGEEDGRIFMALDTDRIVSTALA